MILIVGAADTGRAPMAAAMLRRLLDARGLTVVVESAGVLGHDDDPPSPEAIATMEQMNLDISGHQARTLTDALVERARLLITMDRGAALVARARFPQAAVRLHTLGELAGRTRDIPDPFKMQLGAWLTYAQEIERMLAVALPRIAEMLDVRLDAAPVVPGIPPAPVVAPRTLLAEQIAALLQDSGSDWISATLQINAHLDTLAALPTARDDLLIAYAGLLRTALTMTPSAPTEGQRTVLLEATRKLPQRIEAADIGTFSGNLAQWSRL